MHNIRLHYGIFKQNLSLLILTPSLLACCDSSLSPSLRAPDFPLRFYVLCVPLPSPLPPHLSFPSNGFICSSFIADTNTRPRLHIYTYRNSTSWTPHRERTHGVCLSESPFLPLSSSIYVPSEFITSFFFFPAE